MMLNWFRMVLLSLLVVASAPLVAEVFYDVRYAYSDAGDLIAVRRYTNETAYVERTYEYDAFGRKTRETGEVSRPFVQ